MEDQRLAEISREITGGDSTLTAMAVAILDQPSDSISSPCHIERLVKLCLNATKFTNNPIGEISQIISGMIAILKVDDSIRWLEEITIPISLPTNDRYPIASCTYKCGVVLGIFEGLAKLAPEIKCIEHDTPRLTKLLPQLAKILSELLLGLGRAELPNNTGDPDRRIYEARLSEAIRTSIKGAKSIRKAVVVTMRQLKKLITDEESQQPSWPWHDYDGYLNTFVVNQMTHAYLSQSSGSEKINLFAK